MYEYLFVYLIKLRVGSVHKVSHPPHVFDPDMLKLLTRPEVWVKSFKNK